MPTSLVNLGVNGPSSQITFTTTSKLSEFPAQARTGRSNEGGLQDEESRDSTQEECVKHLSLLRGTSDG